MVSLPALNSKDSNYVLCDCVSQFLYQKQAKKGYEAQGKSGDLKPPKLT